MTDYQTFKHGGVTYPLTDATTNSFLQDSDPTVFYALDFFEAMINTHVGDRLVAECTLSGIVDISAPVAHKIPFDPQPYMTETQFKYPLLCVYRKTADISDKTVVWQHDVCELDVAYILPPITGAQAESIMPVLRAVGVVLINRTELGFDPSYSSGAHVWTLAGLESIGFTKCSFGFYEGMGNLFFPTWTGTLIVKERTSKAADAFDAFEGADVNIDIHDTATNTTVADVVRFESDVVVPGPG